VSRPRFSIAWLMAAGERHFPTLTGLRRPRISIAWLMAVVAMIAVDFAVLRFTFAGLRTQVDFRWKMAVAIIFCLPMLNVLMIGLVLMCRRSRSRAFLLGFEVFGWLAIVGCALDLGVGPGYAIRYLTATGRVWDHVAKVVGMILVGQTGRQLADSLGPWVFITIQYMMICCLPPQLLPALIGGWLFSRERVRLVFERRSSTPEPGMSPP
jgi:hypothetical protein